MLHISSWWNRYICDGFRLQIFLFSVGVLPLQTGGDGVQAAQPRSPGHCCLWTQVAPRKQVSSSVNASHPDTEQMFVKLKTVGFLFTHADPTSPTVKVSDPTALLWIGSAWNRIKLKGRIRICIKVISWIRIRILIKGISWIRIQICIN